MLLQPFLIMYSDITSLKFLYKDVIKEKNKNKK